MSLRPLTSTSAARAFLAASAAATVLLVPASAQAAPPASCTKVAAPNGSDSAAGSVTAPYRTVQHLVESLSAGETGCLRTGTYGGGDVRMGQPDTALQSYPGERAKLTSFLEVYPNADRSRVSGLDIDTTNDANDVGTKIQGDNVVFSDNVVTKGGGGICVAAGSQKHATGIVIENNKIFNCGTARKADGSANKFDHQIYLQGTRNAVVRWNVLTGNAGGWGVHLYPDADGSLVEHNIIDGNQGGVIFAGAYGATSDDNVVRNNAITYSGARWNVEGSWSGGAAGRNNRASNNCTFSDRQSQPSGINTPEGFTATVNTALGGSPYINRAAGDYRFQAGSPCASLVGDVMSHIPGPALPPLPQVSISLTPPAGTSNAAPVAVGGTVTTRVPTATPVRTVAIQVKAKNGWKTVKKSKVRNRRFATKLRLRGAQKRRGGTKVRAVVGRLAQSRAVSVSWR